MKEHVVISGAVVLLALGGWIAWRSAEVGRTEQRVEVLRNQIRHALDTREIDRAASLGTPDASIEEPIALLRRIGMRWQQDQDTSDDRSRLQLSLADLSADELEALLDELAALQEKHPRLRQLEAMIATRLADESSERALTYFSGRFRMKDDNGLFSVLVKAMEAWSADDPVAAAAWLDREVAAGNFTSDRLDATSWGRVQAEGPLVNALLRSDPEAALRRVEALGSDDRKSVLALVSPVGMDAAAYARIVRSSLESENDVRNTFMNGSYHLLKAGLGYEETARFLDESGATPDIRKKVVAQAARRIPRQGGAPTAEAAREVHAWVARTDPGAEDELTAEVLLASHESFPPGREATVRFEEAAALVLQLHQSAGSDGLLAAFIERAAGDGMKEEAAALLPHIANPTKREELSQKLRR